MILDNRRNSSYNKQLVDSGKSQLNKSVYQESNSKDYQDTFEGDESPLNTDPGNKDLVMYGGMKPRNKSY